MAKIRPFHALQARGDVAPKLSSVPYDVVTEHQARAIVRANPLSFLRVTRPEINFSADAPPQDDAAFRKGRAIMDACVHERLLIQRHQPVYYILRQTVEEHVQVGLLCASAIEDFENGIIVRHEQTRTEKVEERTKHIIGLHAHTCPVFLAYRNRAEIGKILDAAMDDRPILAYRTEDGVTEELWAVEDPARVAEITAAFADVPKVYIADGHHRTDAALRASKLIDKAEAGAADGGHRYFLTALFPAEQLDIMPYNRVVKRIQKTQKNQLLAQLKESYGLTRLDEFVPTVKGEVRMYLQGQWWSFALQPLENDPAGSLDANLLQHQVLDPMLGIKDPKTDTNIDFLGGADSVQKIVETVDGGNADVGFCLHPVAIDDFLAVSDAGLSMPPKSTWFWPKLRSGLVIHVF